MIENEQPIVEAENDTPVEAPVAETPEETPDQVIERLQKERDTALAQKDHFKKKSEKAADALTNEPEAPAAEPKPDETKKVELSPVDMLAVAQAKVHTEDLDTVVDYIGREGSAAKALQNEDLQAILERRAEARQVAKATNTGNAKSANADVSVEAIADKAKTNFGSLTEADIDKLAQR